MQRLDASIHDLGETGEFRHLAHGDARVGQLPRRAARGQQLHAARGQLAREFEQPGLVRDGNEGTADRQIHVVARPCS